MVKNIKKAKEFKISHDFFVDLIHNLYGQIIASYIKYDFIVPIPRGGLILSVYLSHLLDIPIMSMETWSFALSSHKDLKDRVLLIDDVIDKGTTIENSSYLITPYCSVACLVLKPWAKIKPRFYAFMTESWVNFDWEIK